MAHISVGQPFGCLALEMPEEPGYTPEVARIAESHLAGIGVGPIDDQTAMAICRGVVSDLLEHLKTLNQRGGQELLWRLLAQNEALLLYSGTLEASLAGWCDLPLPAAQIRSLLAASSIRNLVQRMVIELAVALPPPVGGDLTVSNELLSGGEELLRHAVMADVLRAGLDSAQVCDHGDGPVLELSGHFDAALTHQFEIRVAQAPQRLGPLLGAPLHTDPIPHSLTEALGRALESTTGLNLNQSTAVVAGLADLAHQIGGGVALAPEDRLVAALSLPFDPIAIRELLGWLTLGRFPQYGIQGEDEPPWRFRRTRSYVRRPLVHIGDSHDGRVLAWSAEHVRRSWIYTIDLALAGSALGRTKAMKELQNKAGRWRGAEFERVAQPVLENAGLLVRANLDRLGPRELGSTAAEQPGQIDFLVCQPERRTLTVVEAKSAHPAYIAYDVLREVQRLQPHSDMQLAFGQGWAQVDEVHRHRGGKLNDGDRLLMKVRWCHAHSKALLDFLGIRRDGAPWRVQGRVLTSEAWASELLDAVPLVVTSIQTLTDRDAVLSWLGAAERDLAVL